MKKYKNDVTGKEIFQIRSCTKIVANDIEAIR